MLLVPKVPLPAVMEIMGWSEASMAKRYMHVPNELVATIADQVSDFIWSSAAEAGVNAEVDDAKLSDQQLATIQRLASTLPAPWRQRFADVFDKGDDESTGTSEPV